MKVAKDIYITRVRVMDTGEMMFVDVKAHDAYIKISKKLLRTKSGTAAIYGNYAPFYICAYYNKKTNKIAKNVENLMSDPDDIKEVCFTPTNIFVGAGYLQDDSANYEVPIYLSELTEIFTAAKQLAGFDNDILDLREKKDYYCPMPPPRKIIIEKAYISHNKSGLELVVLAMLNNDYFLLTKELYVDLKSYTVFYSSLGLANYYRKDGEIEYIPPHRKDSKIRKGDYTALITYNEMHKLFVVACKLLGFKGASLNLIENIRYKKSD